MILLFVGHNRAALYILMSGVGSLLVLGYSSLSTVLLSVLTERFPPGQATGDVPTGIIVLGGAIDPRISKRRRVVEVGACAGRIIAMIELAVRFSNCRILYCGGDESFVGASGSEAPLAAKLLCDLGIKADRIILDSESRTTAESAAQAYSIVQPKAEERWLLVTSAFHMPRAMGAFRAVHFDVEPFPVDWITGGAGDARVPFSKLSAGLARIDIVVHEWIGLAFYRLTGQSHELFPRPHFSRS